eukprot:TRINITY_DN1195_c0_g1_i1.p1 TRINITY_DN1195_c0_g1~~TRINITY_DN1195_c0_g1_i1.p1  ORF type:complete len:150 (+),score=24.52 TRINITY_DN1195_c0_g1_i1:51-500(+)
MPSATLKDVSADNFIAACSEELRNKENIINVPEYAHIIKTAPSKEHGPYDPSWYYIRAAAVLRRVYIRPNTGVGAFSKAFGSKARFGHARNHFATASRGIIRNILQQFENAGYMTKTSDKGARMLTPAGRKFCDQIAVKVQKQRPVIPF